MDVKLAKMKLGGGFACCAAFAALFMPSLYTLTQLLVGGLYIYLTFVRYRAGADDDDDKYQKMQADQEMLAGKVKAQGAQALTKINTPKSFGNF